MSLKESTKLTPQLFTKYLFPFASDCQKETGISALAILAQAALESGWNSKSPGWMFFGIKDTDGVNGNEQLITTTEYSRKNNLTPKEVGLVSIIKVEPVLIRGQKFFKYTGKDYFRKYNSPKESFVDHANFFIKNKRYTKALTVKSDPYKFIDEIALAGYATDPNYATTLKSIVKKIANFVV
jgi:flagellar protein FlgJ